MAFGVPALGKIVVQTGYGERVVEGGVETSGENEGVERVVGAVGGCDPCRRNLGDGICFENRLVAMSVRSGS